MSVRDSVDPTQAAEPHDAWVVSLMQAQVVSYATGQLSISNDLLSADGDLFTKLLLLLGYAMTSC